MTRIVIDAELREKLNNLSEPIELCDETGAVLAVVTPKLNPDDWEPVIPEFSEEELEKARNSKTWYTTAEVLKRLEDL